MVEDGVITKNSTATINQASFQTYDTERKNQARTPAKVQNGSVAASGGAGDGGRGGVKAPTTWEEDKAALKRRIAELEQENAMLQSAANGKKVRTT